MNSEYLEEWAKTHGISQRALDALNKVLTADIPIGTGGRKADDNRSEAEVQRRIRLSTYKADAVLWRNNSGACEVDGRHIRYGLGNVSKKWNKHFKSPDLVGVTPIKIEPHHVGRVMGILTTVEVKRPDWKYTGTKAEIAQSAFGQAVTLNGGLAMFATSPAQYLQITQEFKERTQ